MANHAVGRVLAARIRAGEHISWPNVQASAPEGSPILPEFPAHTAYPGKHINIVISIDACVCMCSTPRTCDDGHGWLTRSGLRGTSTSTMKRPRTKTRVTV